MSEKNFLIKGLNNIPDNAYFIRLSDKPEYYIHYDGKLPNGDKKYSIKEGTKGAAVWELRNATYFIIATNAKNLQAVKVSEILPNDGSFN